MSPGTGLRVDRLRVSRGDRMRAHTRAVAEGLRKGRESPAA